MRNSIFDFGRHEPHARFFSQEIVRASAALTGLCLAVLVFSDAAHGDEWAMTPSIQLKTQHNDNLYLSSDSPVSVWGYTASPLMALSKRTAASRLDMEGRLIFNHYSESSVTDPNVQSIKLTGQINSRRSTWGLRSSFKRDTTIATVTDVQNEEQDVGNAEGDVDTNLVQIQVRRNQLRADPFFSYRLTERDSVGLKYTLNHTTYSDEGASALFDYKRQGVEAVLSRSLARNDRISATVSASNYKAPDADTDTDDYALRASWMHNYATDLRGDVSFGLRSTSSNQGGEQIDSSGSVYNASLTKRYSELTSYRFKVERSLRASGAGVVVQSDSFNMDFSHDLSSRLSFSTSLNAHRNQSADFLSSSVDRTYYNVEPQLSWNITRLWSLDGSYQYSWQKYDDQQNSASSNSIFLAIDYAWPKMAVSR